MAEFNELVDILKEQELGESNGSYRVKEVRSNIIDPFRVLYSNVLE